MEGLVGSQLAIGEADGKPEEEEEQQQEEEGMYSDPGLLSYLDELCSQEVFVSKVGWTWYLVSSRPWGGNSRGLKS